MKLCLPALIYFVYALIHMYIELFKQNIPNVLLIGGSGLMVTALLQTLCFYGYTFIAWMIVIIPNAILLWFVAILIFKFKLNPVTGNPIETMTTHANSRIFHGALGNFKPPVRSR